MSGHIVALCEKRKTGWRFKLVLRLYNHDPPRFHPYTRGWRGGFTEEKIISILTKMRLAGEVQEIVGLEE